MIVWSLFGVLLRRRYLDFGDDETAVRIEENSHMPIPDIRKFAKNSSCLIGTETRVCSLASGDFLFSIILCTFHVECVWSFEKVTRVVVENREISISLGVMREELPINDKNFKESSVEVHRKWRKFPSELN